MKTIKIILILSVVLILSGCTETTNYNNPFSGTEFTAFGCAYALDAAIIDGVNKIITLNVNKNADLQHLIVTFVLADGATASVNGVLQESGVSVNDFSDTITYLVTSGNEQNQTEWKVAIFQGAGGGGKELFLNGIIAENTTLFSAKYVVDEDVTVLENVRLEIMPGATLEFKAGKKMTLKTGAVLYAVADEYMPIKFTAQNTDTWDGIVLDKAEGEFRFCYFTKGGENSYILSLLNNSKAGIVNTFFDDCKKGAIRVDADSDFRMFEHNSIANCGETIQNNYPFVIENLTAVPGVGSTNVISTSKGIFLPNSNAKSNLKFQKQTCPFIFKNDVIFDTTDISVVLEAGVVFNMAPGKSIKIAETYNVKFLANGNSNQPVTFTCSEKAAGSWHGIFIGKKILGGSALEYCNFEYAGDCSTSINVTAGAINCSGTTEQIFGIKNCKISNTNSHGIFFNYGSDAELIDNKFSNIPAEFSNIFYAN